MVHFLFLTYKASTILSRIPKSRRPLCDGLRKYAKAEWLGTCYNFHIEILWCRDSLPRYFTLIHALPTKERMPEPLWEQAGI